MEGYRPDWIDLTKSDCKAFQWLPSSAVPRPLQPTCESGSMAPGRTLYTTLDPQVHVSGVAAGLAAPNPLAAAMQVTVLWGSLMAI